MRIKKCNTAKELIEAIKNNPTFKLMGMSTAYRPEDFHKYKGGGTFPNDGITEPIDFERLQQPDELYRHATTAILRLCDKNPGYIRPKSFWPESEPYRGLQEVLLWAQNQERRKTTVLAKEPQMDPRFKRAMQACKQIEDIAEEEGKNFYADRREIWNYGYMRCQDQLSVKLPLYSTWINYLNGFDRQFEELVEYNKSLPTEEREEHLKTIENIWQPANV